MNTLDEDVFSSQNEDCKFIHHKIVSEYFKLKSVLKLKTVVSAPLNNYGVGCLNIFLLLFRRFCMSRVETVLSFYLM